MSSMNYDKCVDCLRKAKTDNEKFASLLMAAKLVHAETCNSESRKALFQAIGFKFLNRLMKTETTADGCTQWTYTSIAVTLLACFCSDEDLSVDPDMLSNIPQFNRIITAISNNTGNEEEGQLISDCYDCLTCFAAQPAGLDSLVQNNTVTALCKCIAQQKLGWEKAHQLLLYINNMCGVETWRNNTEGLLVILQHYAQLFNANKNSTLTPVIANSLASVHLITGARFGEEKFAYCRTLYIILSSIDSNILEGLNNTVWSNDVYQGLFTVLQAKINAECRNPALKLSSVVIDLLGVDWSISSSNNKDNKFLLILVHLCCIEIRITLEQDNFDKVKAQGALLTSCYTLLENMITYMAVGPTLGLDEKQITQLHSAMTGAFHAVIHFIKQLEHAPIEQQQSTITMAAVRVLGSWVAEETAALQRDVISIIPFLLKLSKIALDQQTKQNSESHTEISRAKSNAMDQSESNGGAMETSSDEEERMEDVLKFLVPGLCHLSAEESARSVLLACGGHQLLAEYFSYQYKRFDETKDDALRREVEVCLTTMCGVFLNLVVMETHLVGSDVVFSELLSFLLTTLPQLIDSDVHLVLTFNMCVLCLMLLRHQHENLQVSQATCHRFLSGAITLLWCHQHTEATSSGDSCQLTLKERYIEHWDDISDLWFLGMQALCAVVPLLCELEQLVVRSGWIPSIITTLLAVQDRQVSEITRHSYGMLLYELASLENSQSKLVIIEKGGKQLAEMYDMTNLLGALT